jgi:hypothetical protein
LLAGLVLVSAGPAALAKPIAFTHGTTVMGEYGAGTMTEAQVFYAPKYFLSVGGGYTELSSDIDGRRREITYTRVNYLLKRWNLADAQANVFGWGGVGQAYLSELDDHVFAWNAGAQVDYVDANGLSAVRLRKDEDTYAVWDPIVADITGLLSDDDIARLSGVLDDNSSAAIMLFENTWATRFVDAVLRANGELVLNERIPRRVVDEVLAAATASEAAS